MSKRIVIFTGLWPVGAAASASPKIDAEDFIVCADAGYVACKAAGIKPEAVIGDFDSLEGELISEIDSLGIERIVYPCEKDDTDTMLCVKYGIERDFDDFLIVGGIGGDFGHTMANIQILSFLTDMECWAEINTDTESLFMIDGSITKFSGVAGAGFSVLSYTERCIGVSISNARYELTDAVITHSYPFGVSNGFLNERPVFVSVRQGRLLIIADR